MAFLPPQVLSGLVLLQDLTDSENGHVKVFEEMEIILVESEEYCELHRMTRSQILLMLRAMRGIITSLDRNSIEPLEIASSF